MRMPIFALLASLVAAQVALGQVFTCSTPITIPSVGLGSPYQTVVHVSGMSEVQSVAISLNGLTHSYAADLDILLVGPNGVGAYVLSDAGGAWDFSGGTYAFAIGGEPLTAVNNTIPNGIYQPSYDVADETFPNVSYTPGTLDNFIGADPNGDWRLYVIDDESGDLGSIASWSLIFNSRMPSESLNTYTYQGKIEGNIGPVDLLFTLHRTEWFPAAVSATDFSFNVQDVTPDEDGLFTVQVPFTPSVIDGDARFVEVAVSPAMLNQYTPLSPRQPLTRTPMAEWANKAKTVAWSGISGVPAGFADGTDNTGSWVQQVSDTIYTVADRVAIGTNTATHKLTVVGTNASTTLVESSHPVGTWFTIGNTSAGRYYQIALTGSQSAEGPGKLLFRPSGSSTMLNPLGVTMTEDGRVGIYTNSPDQLLSVNGNASKPGGGSWAVFSDARLKHDITPLTGTLDKLLNVHGVSYFYNEPEKIGELKGRQTGVVAQEVEKVFPEWVEEGASGYKSVTFRGFEALTIEALRDLRNEKDAVAAKAQAQIDALVKENAELKARLEKIEATLMAR